MSAFTYKDDNWKVFSNVNNGTVLNALKTKEEHKNKLFNFLHNTLGVMNFTSKSGQIFYEIKETDLGFEALTKDISNARKIFKDNVIIEKASLEDIMIYTVRGNA